ncbi:MAG: hypothetical protein CMK46_10385 [Porticoccus sp.]|jgi:hypothetical protein|uniref:hypothetical protein n=1 Tax=Porticoccus hydrocarbonoclasticus TaxID=1073414 RepID=UPI00056A8717|nr:hypothetical protein [Porticoccus hydrocarbonoclasticus]MBG58674.1 hypothetical protein [Porticoccus sp.]|tara:strand:- start:118 stop:528 length:411 start_codon:yes stop_codon:yes gene_type:complete
METKKYEAEWCLLQNQFESYEKHSLYIKLSSILMLFLSEIFSVSMTSIFLILLVLWLQDAIWKTFQSRIEPRLLKIEKNIREKTEGSEFQFNREYQLVETSGLSKILEYSKQAIRPTLAFPHIVLMIILVGCSVVG